MRTSWIKSAPILALNALVAWPLYIVLCAMLWAVGVPLIWWAAWKGWQVARLSRVFNGRIIVAWNKRWMNPVWGNEQDGIYGMPINSASSVSWWPDRVSKIGLRKATFQWSALRNSTNNLRFMHHFVPWLGWLNPNTIESTRIRWSGTAVPLEAVLETWDAPHMESCGDDSIMVGAGAYKRRFACLLVRQGPYAGIRIAMRPWFTDRAHQLWIGWKLNTGMAVPGWWPEDPCWKGVGFTCGQVRHLP